MSKQTSKTTLILKEDEYRGDLRLNYPFNLRQEGETKENFAARRNRLYRNRSYFKDALLAEREAAKAPTLTRPRTKPHLLAASDAKRLAMRERLRIMHFVTTHCGGLEDETATTAGHSATATLATGLARSDRAGRA